MKTTFTREDLIWLASYTLQMEKEAQYKVDTANSDTDKRLSREDVQRQHIKLLTLVGFITGLTSELGESFDEVWDSVLADIETVYNERNTY